MRTTLQTMLATVVMAAALSRRRPRTRRSTARHPTSWKERRHDHDDTDTDVGRGSEFTFVGDAGRASERHLGHDAPEPRAHFARTHAALRRDDPAGALHRAVRVHLRWRHSHPRWWELRELSIGRPALVEPRDLDDG